MEVILLERVKNLGDLGDKVKVKSGFGRNFLIPQKKAISANKQNVELFEKRRAELEKAAAEKLKLAEARATKLNGLSLSMVLQASEEGKLFGSVGTVEITQAIEEAGVEAEKREILMPEGPLHHIGDYDVNVQVHSDVIATIKLSITAAE